MMCARRLCGCNLRRSTVIQLTVVIVAVVALGGATGTVIQDVLNGILIVSLVLVAAMVAFFVVQVRHSVSQPVHPRRAPRVAHPRPAKPKLASPQSAPAAPVASTGPVASTASAASAALVASVASVASVGRHAVVGEREAARG
jgi:hypothetical protein